MCLFDTKRFRFTFKPIKVYKMVFESPNGELISPYRYAPIKRIMFALFGSPKKFHIDTCYTYTRSSGGYTKDIYVFEDGFIHAYKSKFEAMAQVNASNFMRQCCYDDRSLEGKTKAKLIEGYIPPFVRYAGEENAICARLMILKL